MPGSLGGRRPGLGGGSTGGGKGVGDISISIFLVLRSEACLFHSWKNPFALCWFMKFCE